MKSILLIFFSVKPGRAIAVLVCLLVASIIEGIGLASLLPIIAIAGDQAQSDSTAQEIVLSVLSFVGLKPELGHLLVFMVGSLVLKALISLMALGFVGYTAAQVVTDLRRQIIENLLNVRWRYFVHHPSGKITNVISNDATRAADAYTLAATFVAMAGQTVVLATVAMIISWQLALVAFAMGSVMTAMLHVLVRVAKRAGLAQTQRTGDLVVFLSDTLANLKLIRAMNRQAPFAQLFEKKIDRLRRALRKQVVSREAVANLQDAVMALFLGTGFFVLYQNFTVPLAELLVSGVVVAKSVSSIGKLQKAYQRAVLLESAFISTNRLIEETGIDPEPVRGTRKPSFSRSVSFNDLTFGYDEHLVLNGVNLEIEQGKLTVLTGPSGAGKSTIVDILFGLYRPSGGSLLIDRVDSNLVDIKAWRDRLGYVPQDVTLLHDTIAANISLGDHSITESRMWAALDASGVSDAIRELPDQLNTMVGERGARFSGGQRQRLALARALITDPELLVLDEVTSALDHATAYNVANQIHALTPKTTVLAVTHRPEFLHNADVIYRIENGKATLQDRSEP